MPISSPSADARTSQLPPIDQDCAIRLLGFHARVIGPGDLVEEVRALFPPAPSWVVPAPEAASPTAATTFTITPDVPPGAYLIAQDRRLRWATRWRDEVAPFLEWAICAAAVDHLGP